MPEYRYKGTNLGGQPVEGTISCQDSKTLKKRLKEISGTKRIRVDSVQKKTIFVYKVQKGTGQPIKGEQKAFEKQELHSALTKMGFKVLSVRKKWINIGFGVPSKELVLFIRICADLLREGFPYDEILTLVGSDSENSKLRDTIQEIQLDLSAGKEGHQVYSKHANVLGKFTAHMLAVASTSGNMATMYESTAKFLERYEEFRRNLRSILFTPAVVTVGMFAATGFYIMYIFPKMTEMLIKYNIDIPPMTKATLGFSQFLNNYYLTILALAILPIVGLIKWARSNSGRYLIDRALIRLPYLGPILHKNQIEIFSRVFYALYSSSGQNIEAIRIAAESCNNKFMEAQLVNRVIPMMLKEGTSFVDALLRANCFTTNAIRRFKVGEESGTLRKSALQLANYYEADTSHKMKGLVDTINLFVSVVISIMIIGLTLLSSEIGFVSPQSPLAR